MKKYLVRFVTKDGDYDKEWWHADSKQAVEDIIRHEHHNIKSISSIEEI